MSQRILGQQDDIPPRSGPAKQPLAGGYASLIDTIIQGGSSKPRSADIKVVPDHVGQQAPISTTCEWCRRRYGEVEERKAHEERTTPRWSIGDGRYICEARTPQGRNRQPASPDKSDILESSYAGQAPLLANHAQISASLKCPVIFCGEMYSTQALLDLHLSIAHERTIVEGGFPLSDSEDLARQDVRKDDDEGKFAIGQDSDHDEQDSEDDDLGDLIDCRDADGMTRFYGTSIPVGGSFGSFSFRTGSMSPLTSLR